MITRPTCLLLGAGASFELGYPLGAALVASICDRWRHVFGNGNWPYWSLQFGIPDKEELFDSGRGLLQGLCATESRSPDEFLERFPEFLEVGKASIAYCLLQVENHMTIYDPARKPWFSHLKQCLLTDTVDGFRKNKLSIVTFNYDRSLEAYLHSALRFHFKIDEKDAWELLSSTVDIVHLHGIIAPYPRVPYGAFDRIPQEYRNGSTIKIIHEAADVDPVFAEGRSLLVNSERVICAGFSFGDINMRRLQFFETDEAHRKDISAIVGTEDEYKRLSPVLKFPLFGKSCGQAIPSLVRFAD